jgi:diphthine synthase
MLYLVGLGLHDTKDISLKGLDIVKKSDKIYAEFYTSVSSPKEELEKVLGKPIILLSREEVETGFDRIVEDAKNKEIVLLTGGDPMVATTHSELLLQAHKAGVKFKVIHASSIVSAIAETGLQIYKFGRSASIPFDEKITSFFDVIKQNKEQGLHTILFLDLDPSENRYLSVEEALKRLERLGFDKETKIVVVSDLGNGSTIKYSPLEVLKNQKFKGLQVLVILGELHFKEKEILEEVYS